MSGKKFLLVDDDEIFCSVLSRALSRQHITAATAHNTQQALNIIDRDREITHAVVDLNMGEESGLALIPQLLSKHAELKIIVLTGYSSIATTVEAIKRGAANYLCKPASVEEIIRAFELQAENKEIPQSAPSVERLEWEYIQKTLRENEGNISATARALGMHRRTLQRKLQKKPVRN